MAYIIVVVVGFVAGWLLNKKFGTFGGMFTWIKEKFKKKTV